MCGIAGILYFQGSGRADRGLLERMANSLRHRGPDGQGFYIDPVDGACGLGHRRLAVIDLAGGNQPLCNEDKTVWLSYNGEIYNFRQLRAELQKRGHHFATACDTEVIVHLYEERGVDCLKRLRGMFAFGLWDQKTRRLMLGRDRLGQKPLYYHCDGQRVIFASELKGLLRGAGLRGQLDPRALDSYLTVGYVPAPQCIVQGIKKLEPASVVIFDAAKVQAEPAAQRYWHLPEGGGYAGGYEQAKENLRETLSEAAVIRTVADVPLGVLLSGGIDSSIVTALLAGAGAPAVRTFTIGFDDKSFDEAKYGRMVAERYGTEHNELRLEPSCLDVLEEIVEQFDEPFADSSAIPTYQVCRLARGHVTVALTGDGGDEAFGGYQRYRAVRLAERWAGPGTLGRGILKWGIWGHLPARRFKSVTTRLARFAEGLADSISESYLNWLSLFGARQRCELYTEDFAESLRRAQNDQENPWGLGGFAEHLANLFEHYSAQLDGVDAAGRVDTLSYLPGDILRKVDAASMAVSLECRSPFLDHKVVELASGFPAEWKLGPRRGKQILRDTFGALLPKAILRRPKMGFGVPLDRWFRSPLRELLCHTLLSGRARSRGWFRNNLVEHMVSEHLASRAQFSQQLWALLMLELWARKYLDGTSNG